MKGAVVGVWTPLEEFECGLFEYGWEFEAALCWGVRCGG